MRQNKILASSCRRKILKALSEKKEVTIMKLVQMVNSTYNEVDRNLRVLEHEGIITQRCNTHKRIIRLNYENEETLVLLKILKILECAHDHRRLHRSLKLLMENTTENGKRL
ncbi:MAG: hypothetical protein N3E52_05110 [Candidatus Bathyarchaeota archaeon]|nr:hypothetical protein [Candidatus Bathyarchaeota archaeon]